MIEQQEEHCRPKYCHPSSMDFDSRDKREEYKNVMRNWGNLSQKKGKTTINKFNATSNNNNDFRVNVRVVFHY